MTIVVSQLFRSATNVIRQIEITLFGYNGQPLETRFIYREDGIHLIKEWDSLQVYDKLTLTVVPKK